MENYVRQIAGPGYSLAVASFEVVFDDIFVDFGSYVDYSLVNIRTSEQFKHGERWLNFAYSACVVLN